MPTTTKNPPAIATEIERLTHLRITEGHENTFVWLCDCGAKLRATRSTQTAVNTAHRQRRH